MEAGGTTPAGSSRALRLDPFALPVRFSANDAGADGHVRQIELHRERVILRRAVHGMRMAVGVPVAAFLGIAIRLNTSGNEPPGAITVCLEHRDHALSVPLFTAADSEDVLAVWQSWARVLGLPLLVARGDGALQPPYPCIGRVRLGKPACRRRRRTAIRKRRPMIMLRRQPGHRDAATEVHRGEREIIARS
ncbi:MAG: hypothetical protein HY659_15590 [Rhizobiales bacterium]|nr:hypothetical protein [Hyphomicrobiales bacterium]